LRIVISACLCGVNCKYNGKNNYSKKAMEYIKGHEVTMVCPEELGGMETPRDCAEIKNGRVVNSRGEDVHDKFLTGARKAASIAKANGAETAVLQSRSPSCGVKQIYDGSFTGRLIKGQGLFAKELIKNGITVIDVEDI
jgi:uncharacterized protein YbbK (DUF523 family)